MTNAAEFRRNPETSREGFARPGFDALFTELGRGGAEKPDAPLPSLREFVERAEAWRITQALHACRGNRSAAARSLGIGRRTLYSKMEKLGIGA